MQVEKESAKKIIISKMTKWGFLPKVVFNLDFFLKKRKKDSSLVCFDGFDTKFIFDQKDDENVIFGGTKINTTHIGRHKRKTLEAYIIDLHKRFK